MSIYDERPYPRLDAGCPYALPTAQAAIKHSLAHAWHKCFRSAPPSQPQILDIGCGSGLKTLWLQELNTNAKVLGMDCSANSINAAHSRARAAGNSVTSFDVGQFGDLSQYVGFFDYINCDETIYLQKDIGFALSMLSLALKDGGIIRVNFHSRNQRHQFYRSQDLARYFGIYQIDGVESRVNTFGQLVSGLKNDLPFKKRLVQATSKLGVIAQLNNLLLEDDKGISPEDLRSYLALSHLKVACPIHPQQWRLSRVFNGLPEKLLEASESFDWLQIMSIIDSIAPCMRLFDLYLVKESKQTNPFSLAESDSDSEYVLKVSPVFRDLILPKILAESSRDSKVKLSAHWPRLFGPEVMLHSEIIVGIAKLANKTTGLSSFDTAMLFDQPTHNKLLVSEASRSLRSEAISGSYANTINFLAANEILFSVPPLSH